MEKSCNRAIAAAEEAQSIAFKWKAECENTRKESNRHAEFFRAILKQCTTNGQIFIVDGKKWEVQRADDFFQLFHEEELK
jgi:hypothetical protein